jgi:hypothetical protein
MNKIIDIPRLLRCNACIETTALSEFLADKRELRANNSVKDVNAGDGGVNNVKYEQNHTNVEKTVCEPANHLFFINRILSND